MEVGKDYKFEPVQSKIEVGNKKIKAITGALFDIENYVKYIKELQDFVLEIDDNAGPVRQILKTELERVKGMMIQAYHSLTDGYESEITKKLLFPMNMNGFPSYITDTKAREGIEKYLVESIKKAAEGEKISLPKTDKVEMRNDIFLNMKIGDNEVALKYIPRRFLGAEYTTLFYYIGNGWKCITGDGWKELVEDFLEISNKLKSEDLDPFKRQMFLAHLEGNVEERMKFLLELIATFNVIEVSSINAESIKKIERHISEFGERYKPDILFNDIELIHKRYKELTESNDEVIDYGNRKYI